MKKCFINLCLTVILPASGAMAWFPARAQMNIMTSSPDHPQIRHLIRIEQPALFNAAVPDFVEEVSIGF